MLLRNYEKQKLDAQMHQKLLDDTSIGDFAK